MLKVPGWELMIVWYFFLGGIAGGAYFTAAIADYFGTVRDRAVARTGYLLSLLLVGKDGGAPAEDRPGRRALRLLPRQLYGRAHQQFRHALLERRPVDGRVVP